MKAPSDAEQNSRARATDLSKRERHAARIPPLFEREGHVVFVSSRTKEVSIVPQEEGMAGSKASDA